MFGCWAVKPSNCCFRITGQGSDVYIAYRRVTAAPCGALGAAATELFVVRAAEGTAVAAAEPTVMLVTTGPPVPALAPPQAARPPMPTTLAAAAASASNARREMRGDDRRVIRGISFRW